MNNQTPQIWKALFRQLWERINPDYVRSPVFVDENAWVKNNPAIAEESVWMLDIHTSEHGLLKRMRVSEDDYVAIKRGDRVYIRYQIGFFTQKPKLLYIKKTTSP